MQANNRNKKVILHIDGDAFFVGVEVAKNQKLKGLPVVTGQERGIVSALSYEAKALGITRGMPIFTVKKKFPSVIVLPGDYASYVSYSKRMMDIVRRYADDVEEYSIDECFADLTGLDKPLKMSYRHMAEKIQQEIASEMKLSVTIGIAPTKVLAKVASKWQKPNGLTIIEESTRLDFLAHTKIESVWGIGRATASMLRSYGVCTASDFANSEMSWVRKNFSKPYIDIWLELNGIMVSEINSVMKTTFSSIQKTRTFHPSSSDCTFLFSQISKHIEEACRKARYYRLTTRRFSIFLKDKDFSYSVITIDMNQSTNAPEILLSLASERMKEIYREGVLYRTAGVTLENLVKDAPTQSDLFGESDRVRSFEELHSRIDQLENKFGKKVVHLGSTDSAIKYKESGVDSDSLDRNLLFL
jgi:DNA polymerase-4/DNA polymerase V